MFKRKRSFDEPSEPHWLATHSVGNDLSPTQTLCVETHEVDLVAGKEHLALALEAPASGAQIATAKASVGTRGYDLIKWNGNTSEDSDIWADRFDARLLLSELPVCCSSQTKIASEPGSPISSSGWSDLPSDAEDAFFLSPSEVADMRCTKRRRLLEQARTERLAALRAVGDDSFISEDGDTWGGSDEEPDTDQSLLMERTAAHLYASPDRMRLKARILANHGADKRFAFLRGRWRRAWVRAQAKAAAEEEEKKRIPMGTHLAGLAAYGDSDEDENEEEQVPELSSKESSGEIAKLEARRVRAREWAAKRRAEKADTLET